MYGENFRAYYSLGRFIALYLDEQKKLRPFVQAIGNARTVEEQRAVLERHVDFGVFLQWTDGLP